MTDKLNSDKKPLRYGQAEEGTPMAVDQYHRRVVPYSIVEAQVTTFKEHMLRTHMYEISGSGFRAIYPGDSSEIEPKILSVLKELGMTASFRDARSLSCVAESDASPWVVAVNLPATAPLSVPDEDDDQELEPEQTHPIHFGAHYIDLEFPVKFLKALLENGFTLYARQEDLEINFAFPCSMGIRIEPRFTKKLKMSDVEKNYSPEVYASCVTIVKRINQSDSGLVLLSGEVGTGKSYMLKAMLSELIDSTPVIPIPAHQFLTNAGMIADIITDNKKSVIILEDIGDVLAREGAFDHADARANLLNLSEGLLSLLGNVILVFSLNYEEDRLDPAVVRPGRSLGSVKFDKLPFEQVRDRLTQEGVDLVLEKKSYTLAEVYEMIRSGQPLSKTVSSAPMGLSRK